MVRLDGRDYYTGAWGTKEADAEYDRLVADYLSRRHREFHLPPITSDHSDLHELLVQFDVFAKARWDKGDGSELPKEFHKWRRAMSIAVRLHGSTRAAAFDAVLLESVRMEMIRLGWTRKFVNRCCRFIVNAFRWGVKQKIVPATTWAELAAVEPLKRGEFAVKEGRKVRPVPARDFGRTVRFCRPIVRDLVTVQYLAGMRPGEACAMRPCDIDRTGRDPSGVRHQGVWVYVPTDEEGDPAHKTAHLDVTRVIFLGPRAQKILAKYINRPAETFLFSPWESREQWFQRLRTARKTPVQPSQTCRRAARPQRVPGERYRTTAIGRAVRNAARRAGAPHWHPHQLRHLRATQIRSHLGQDGPEAARVVLGHKLPGVTGIYAESDLRLAARAMREMG